MAVGPGRPTRYRAGALARTYQFDFGLGSVVVVYCVRGLDLDHPIRPKTALAKSTFRDAARHRRCVVPVDAWFERGIRPGAGRGQHQIATHDRAGVAFAAIWWQSAGDGPRRLVIVTKQATGAPARIHHRAPMVVRDDEVND